MFINKELINTVERKLRSPLVCCMMYFYRAYQMIHDFIRPTHRRLIVGITITEKCNLNCIYCYQKIKSDKTISLNKIQGIITHILEANSIWTDIEFRFLGGEPFIESQLMHDVIEWALKKKWGKKFIFKITTNGTHISAETKKWLEKYKERVNVILSLDGFPSMHNKNRSNSFQDIDYSFFKDLWPDESIKMTISKETINELFNSIIYIIDELKLNVSFNPALGQGWGSSELKSLKIEQEKLITFYSHKDKLKLPPIYNFCFSRILNIDDSTRQCGIGKNIIAYDTEGSPFPCYMFLPNVLKINNIPKISEFHNDTSLKDNYCDECIIKNICPTCYAFNFLEREQSSMRDHSFCAFYKEIIKCSAQIKMNRFSKKHFFSEKEVKEINAILYLNNHLN